jgi:NAD(P)-dependent dehydrogenase (short-subunit alcohol dehydrogenase family)
VGLDVDDLHRLTTSPVGSTARAYHTAAVSTDVQAEPGAPRRETLAGKAALVTGAAHEQGIGRGIALVLAERGADVAVNDLGFEAEAARRVDELEALGRRSVFVRADVSRPEENERLVAEVADRLGRLDIFVANAGVARWERLDEVRRDSWDLITSVNLHGVLYGCRAAAAQMRRQGDGGRIVITSSVHAAMPGASLGVYGATKHAVGLLVGVMAREWGADGISVNHVGPGWVDTDINVPSPHFATAEARDAARAAIPLGRRPAEPREIGEAVAYLAESTYTTGAYLRVDGGLVIGKY